MLRITWLTVCVGALAMAATSAAGVGADPDRAFQEFFAAGNRDGASKRIDAILRAGITFDEALARIRRGRDYAAGVPLGSHQGKHRTYDGTDHPFRFTIPQNYDPTRAYQLRVQLHGGVARSEPPDAGRMGLERLAGTVDEISAYPAGWAESVWWDPTQVDNLNQIIDTLKRTYNVDENRVYLTGSSDGGTGAYFMAFRDTTPWSSFLPLIGNMTVLASPDAAAAGEIFPGNAVNKPFFVVNAGRDRLYPAHVVQPYVEHLKALGADVVFHVQPDSDHSTAWWPEERAAFEKFVRDHPRDPLPDRLSWETEQTNRYQRAHWLIIDRLGNVEGQTDLPDSNLLNRGREYDFGVRINSNIDRGRRVADVLAGSNAQRLGLRPGDLIVSIDERVVQTARDVFEAMQQWPIGSALHLSVDRAGRRLALEGTFQPDEVEVPPLAIFPRHRPSGRVDLVRTDNLVKASTRGVREFTLLLSPSKFDFSKPVTVVANGRTVFSGPVTPSTATLLKWAARDDDRTMVFGAELHINLDK